MAILNKYKDEIPKEAIYIGRGSMWGNPFVIGKDGDRDEVCEKYSEYLKKGIRSGEVSLSLLASLHGKDLVCFCSPLRCHGHTLEKAAKWAYEIEKKQREGERNCSQK